MAGAEQRATGRPVGRVQEIRVFPVRSMAGTTPDTVPIGAAGLAGDRSHVVVGEDGAPIRGKHAPQLRETAPTGDPEADAAALTRLLGRPVRLAPAEQGAEGSAPVHLVSRQALDRAAAGQVPAGCSAEDPRANVVLDLTGDDDERAWVGRSLCIGGAVLALTRLPKHCLGVYAEVRRAGQVTVGDPVLLDGTH